MYEPDVAEQQRLQELREVEHVAPDRRERAASIAVSGSAVVAMAALWLFPPAGHMSWPAAVVCVAAVALTGMVRFEVGGGFTVPVQLAFVPLAFAVPAQVLPIATVLGLAAARLRGVVSGETSPGRLVFSLENSWFAIGPAVVLAIVGGSEELRHHPAYVVALVAAQLAGDFAASTLRELIIRGIGIREQLREAAWVYAVDAALTPIPAALLVSGVDPIVVVLVTAPVVGLLQRFAQERSNRLDGLFELSHAYHGTALLLGDIVDADDSYTGEHSQGVVALAMDVGRQMQLDANRLRNLEFSALLHDIGKVAIPKEIINKTGALDPDEWALVKTHTLEGQRMLDRIGGFMQEVGAIVRSHHERWDGGGYPDGLAGEQIPLEARIVTACDSYNAMTTTRSYRRAMAPLQAARELRAHRETQFDPAVVAALLVVLDLPDTPARGAVALRGAA